MVSGTGRRGRRANIRLPMKGRLRADRSFEAAYGASSRPMIAVTTAAAFSLARARIV